MSFKEYCKEHIKFGIALICTAIFFYFLIVYNYKSYALGDLTFNICLYVCAVIMLGLFFFGDYRQINQACIACQRKYEKEKTLYKNFTFDDFVDLVYKDDVLNLELIGCPYDLSAEQEVQFVKDYIKKLIEKDDV